MPIYNTNKFWNYVSEESEFVIDRVKSVLTWSSYNYDTKTTDYIPYYQVIYEMTIDNNQYTLLRFPAGLTKFLVNKTNLSVVNQNRNFDYYDEKDILKVCEQVKEVNPNFEVRDYQVDAVLASLSRFTSIIQSTTGSGKTSIMSLLCCVLNKKRTLITNGNNFILKQIYDRLQSFGITDISYNPGNDPDYSKRIVILNTSSSDSRLNRQDEAYISFLKEVELWIIDEASHFQSLTNFEPIFYMDHDKLEHIVGYTATPFRNYKDPYNNQDDFTLISLLGEPAFIYEMKDTIHDENIAQPYSYFINYPNKAAYVPPQFKDNYYMQYRANITYNKARNKAGLEMLKFLNKNGIKTLAYFNNIKPGQALLKSLTEEGVKSLFICGDEKIYEWVEVPGKGKNKGTTKLKLEERSGNIDDVKQALDSGYNIILGSSVMSEGVDINTFQAAVLFSAGKSYIGIVQLTGRAARKKEKDNICFIIDFKDVGGYDAFANQYRQRKQAMLDSGVINIPDVHKFINMIEEIAKNNKKE